MEVSRLCNAELLNGEKQHYELLNESGVFLVACKIAQMNSFTHPRRNARRASGAWEGHRSRERQSEPHTPREPPMRSEYQ
jgi:hypothetical protein